MAQLIDDNTIRNTLGEHFIKSTLAEFAKKRTRNETGRSVGKIVLEGFNMSDSEVISNYCGTKSQTGKIDAV